MTRAELLTFVRMLVGFLEDGRLSLEEVVRILEFVKEVRK